jgi:hypothetical protein
VRADEALRLFADMGRVGQVIDFTHHQHLAELAKAVCLEARVHELAASRRHLIAASGKAKHRCRKTVVSLSQ